MLVFVVRSLSICLSPHGCPAAVKLTSSGPACKTPPVPTVRFIPWNSSSSQGGEGQGPAPGLINFCRSAAVHFSLEGGMTRQCWCGELEEVTDSIRGSYIIWLGHHLIMFTRYAGKQRRSEPRPSPLRGSLLWFGSRTLRRSQGHGAPRAVRGRFIGPLNSTAQCLRTSLGAH